MDYFVEPWFWGRTFPLATNDPRFPSTPYNAQQFADSLKFAAGHNYFSALKQYGAGRVVINDPSSFADAWPPGSDGFVAKFTAQGVIDFITSQLDKQAFATFGKPIFLVVIPHGSVLDPAALGAHSTFSYKGHDLIWAWMYGSNNVNDAMLTATHEIVESIGADGSAPKELCDDCSKSNPKATLPRGLTVSTYFDASTNQCVAPGSLEYSDRLSYAADILWHNRASNETQIWFMDDGRITGRGTVMGEEGNAAFVGPPWGIVGAGDFNGDGKADILWHNGSTNETQIWFMDGAKVSSRGTVLGEDGHATFVGLPWSIVGIGDFNNDNKADILWHNSATNESQIWFMDGSRTTGRATVIGEDGNATFIGPPWSIVGTGDLNGDGKADILWHNSSSNEIQIWFMDGRKVSSRRTVIGETGDATFVGPPWSIVAVGDFNGDERADILWHNAVTNETQVWFMDGWQAVARRTVTDENDAAIFVGQPWSIVGSALFLATVLPAISVSGNDLQELSISGRGFTARNTYSLSIRNVPGRSGDIQRSHSVGFDGTFTLSEPLSLTRVNSDAQLPDIEVVARDDATGRSVTEHTSPRPFIVR